MVHLYKLLELSYFRIHFIIFIISFLFGYNSSSAQNNPVAGDFKNKTSGNWDDYTIWQVFNGTEFIDADEGQTPDESSSVYLEAGFTVTLTKNESIDNFHFNTEEDVLRFDTQDHTLEVWGKLRGYTGIAPGGNASNTSSDISNPLLLMKTGAAGRIKLRGTSRTVTVPNDFNAGRRLAGWTLEVALDEGEIGQFLNSIRVGTLIVSSGTMEVPADGSHYIRVDMTGPDAGINGKVIIKSGATLIPGAGLLRSNAANNYFEELTVEEGGSLLYKQRVGSGAASALLAQTINMNGTFGLIRGANQVFPSTTLNSTTTAAKLDNFNNLLLSESGTKALTNPITVNGILELKGTASINLNSFTLAYGSDGTVKYSGSSMQTTTVREFPNANGPKNLIINNPLHVNLHENKTLTGDLLIESGRLMLGNNNITLGEESKVVGTAFSSNNMILLNGTGIIRKLIPSIGSFMFPIGESNGNVNYSPVQVTLNSGNLDASTYMEIGVKGVRHPDDSSPNNYLSRYWTIQTNIADIEYDAVFHYLDNDVTGDEISLNSYLYTATAKTPVNSIDHELNQMVVTNMTSGGDFSGSNICGITGNSLTKPATTVFCSSGNPETMYGGVPNTGGSIGYEWEKRIGNGPWQRLAPEVSRNFDEGLINSPGKYAYRRVVYTDACTEGLPHYSNNIIIIIDPDISQNTLSTPSVTDYCESTSGFTIEGSTPEGGDGSYTYLWERRLNGGSWTSLEKDQKDYVESELSEAGSYEYRRTVTSRVCLSTSISVSIIISPPLDNNVINATTAYCGSATGIVIDGSPMAGGTGNYIYEWERRFNNGNWESLPHSTVNYTENSSLTAKGIYEYRRKVKSGLCENFSNIATVELFDALVLSAQISPATGSQNDGSISILASGGKPGYTYTWSNQAATNLLEGLTHGSYTITLTDANGCQLVQEFIVPQVTGIKFSESDNFITYPNPFKDEIAIEFEKSFSKVSIAFLNAQGKTLISKEIDNNLEKRSLIRLNTADLPVGFYYLNVISEGRSKIIKLHKVL